MKYENFNEIVTIKKQLDNLYVLLKEVEEVKRYRNSDAINLFKVKLTILTLEAYIPDRYDALALEYIDKLIDQINGEILECKRQLDPL